MRKLAAGLRQKPNYSKEFLDEIDSIPGNGISIFKR